MKGREIDWSLPQRQSAAAVFVVMAKAIIDVMKFLWPVLIVFLLRSRKDGVNSWEIVVLIVPVISVIAALMELYFFRFFIRNGELVVRKGIFERKTIVLPVEKIQAVHIDRTWLHNLFSAAQITFDSAGSEKVEIRINALRLWKAEALRTYLSVAAAEKLPGEAEQVEEEKEIITLGLRDLMKLSISSNHLEAFFILLAFALSLVDNIGQIIGKKADGFWQWVGEFAQGSSSRVILFLVVVILVVSVAISIARILLLYLDFRISRNAAGFRIKTGLINMKEKLVPFRKVQYLSWRANWLRRKMDLHLLKFHIVGSELIKDKQEIRVPVTRKEFIPQLVEPYYHLLPTDRLIPLRIQPAYVGRTVLMKALLPSLIIFIPAFFYFGFIAAWIFLLVPLVAVHARFFQQRFRVWSDGEAIQVRRQVLAIEESLVKWNNLQRIELRQSVFQRRRKLATIWFQTAGGSLAIPFLKEVEARAFVNFALYKVESANMRWM